MPLVTKFPAANNAGWTNSNNGHADDGVYATAAPAKNGSLFVEYGNFGFDTDVPLGSTINSCTIEVQWKVSTASSVATLGAQAWVNNLASGTELVDSAEPLTDTIRSTGLTGITSADQIRDGTFEVRIRASRGNSNTAVTASLDYVKVIVDYGAGPVSVLGELGGSLAGGLDGSAVPGAATVAAALGAALAVGLDASASVASLEVTVLADLGAALAGGVDADVLPGAAVAAAELAAVLAGGLDAAVIPGAASITAILGLAPATGLDAAISAGAVVTASLGGLPASGLEGLVEVTIPSDPQVSVHGLAALTRSHATVAGSIDWLSASRALASVSRRRR